MRYISCNGKVTVESSFPIDPGYLFGYGLFETLKVYNHKIIHFQEHMKRLSNCSPKIGLEYQLKDSQVHEYCKELIAYNKINNGALRITYSKGTQGNNLIVTSRENPYTDEIIEKGFALKTSVSKRNETSRLVSVKSNNYLENLLILNSVKEQGYNEALLYNTKGFLAEGTMSNIFFIKNDRIFTPALKNGILSGIIRDKVNQLAKRLDIPLEEGNYREYDLMSADEIFITNSLMEIMPVRLLDQQEFKMDENSVTNDLIEKYRRFNY